MTRFAGQGSGPAPRNPLTSGVRADRQHPPGSPVEGASAQPPGGPLLHDERRYLTEALLEAMSMVRCPYYRKGEKCNGGCWTEPRCITDAPTEGWEARIASLRAQIRDDHKGAHDA